MIQKKYLDLEGLSSYTTKIKNYVASLLTKYAPMDNSAGAWNGIYHRKNLLDEFSLDELSSKIALGDFSGIPIGSYIETDIKPSVDGAVLALSGNSTSGTTAYDISGNANNATMNNVTLSSDTDKAFVFNGTNSSFANISGSLLGDKSEFTFFVKAKLTQYSIEGSMIANYSVPNYQNFIMGYTAGSGFLTYLRKASGGVHTVSTQYPLNTDLTYAVTFKGGNFARVYINGVMTNEITTDLPSSINFGQNNIEIGHWSTKYFNGTMKGIKIYPRALSADEILQLHNATQDEGLTERVRPLVAGLDHYLHCGNTPIEDHHLVMVFEDCLKNTAKMHNENNTSGGYANSYMYKVVRDTLTTNLFSALPNHVCNFNSAILFSTSVNTTLPSIAGAGLTGASNNWTWKALNLQLMNEIELYGTTALSSSFYDVGNGKSQFPLFRLRPDLIQCGRGINGSIVSRSSFWLRSVASSTTFCNYYYNGIAHNYSASYSSGVRPFFLFK